MSTYSSPFYQPRSNPMIYTGLFSSAIVGLLGTILLIISYSKKCNNITGKITKRECCKQTWERFSSSVPITIFITSLIIFFLALGFINFGKGKI